MSFYKACPFCGANLDPGEKCDCQKASGESDGNRDYAGGAEKWQYRNSGEGSRKPVERDIGAQEQQESGADSF